MQAIPALVRPRDDAEALELALIENMAREDLSPIEEARACAALVEELGLTREQVGRRVGRSRVAVSNLVRLLDLPDEVIELLQDGALSEGHGRALLLAEDHGARSRLARAAVQEGWSVRTVEARAREHNAAAGMGAGTARSRAGRRGDGRVAGELHPDQEQAIREIADALRRRSGRRCACGQRARADIARSCRLRRLRRRSSWHGGWARAPWLEACKRRASCLPPPGSRATVGPCIAVTSPRYRGVGPLVHRGRGLLRLYGYVWKSGRGHLCGGYPGI